MTLAGTVVLLHPAIGLRAAADGSYRREMSDPGVAAREAALAGLLTAVVRSDLDAWLARPEPLSDPAYDEGLLVLGCALAREWGAAGELAAGHAVPDDATARRLHHGAAAWAAAGDEGPGSAAALAPFWAGDLPDVGTPLGQFAGYLAVESALAHARLDLAHQVAERLGGGLWADLVLDGDTHPFSPLIGACRARLLAFRGEVGAADAVHRALPAAADATVAGVLAATGSLVRGNGADREEVRRLAALVVDLVPEPRDHLTAGAHLLVAFGLIAVGDVPAAVRSLLAAGHDGDLAALDVIDRALGLELLVALAVAEGDLDTAEVWRDRAAPLLTSPIADSTVARIHSRVALLAGDPEEAVVWAERAVARAQETGRGIELAEGQIVLNRARIAHPGPGRRLEAAHDLAEMVADAERRGHRAPRRSASRELRPIGVRLPPLVGSGWAGLSNREAEVAHRVIEGATNREVATRLHVSEHTVRAHVSRVLAAFGVATRSALPAAAGTSPSTSPSTSLSTSPGTGARPPLTARQEQVAALVAEGLHNRDVADRLGLSVRTVERHVADILERWDLGGRTAIARVVQSRVTLSTGSSA